MKNVVVGAALFCMAGVVGAVGCGTGRQHGVIGIEDLAGQQTGDDFAVAFDDMGNPISTPDGGTPITVDPTTCAEAASSKSYIGCDYWPTVTANAVWSIFDFAVVVSNPGSTTASVTVTGPMSTNQTVMVAPNAIQKIYLPWVSSLKGMDADSMGGTTPQTASVLATGSAYHLVATVPVLVYQFNALEYAPMGGPPGKNWAACPGDNNKHNDGTPPCFSYSNDASLLLPSTAMTGNYRIYTEHSTDGCSAADCGVAVPGIGSYVAITATVDGTTVKVQMSSTGAIQAGGTSIPALAAGATGTYSMNAGDVIELLGVGSLATDLSGSLINATNPVQVISGVSAIANPSASDQNTQASCRGQCTQDHIEEIIQPAETLGKHYVVTMPTNPHGTTAAPATVRFVGNVDGTTLTYSSTISGAPTTLNAGQVVEIAKVTQDFEVSGNHEFIVSTISFSGGIADTNPGPSGAEGDPSLSFIAAVEQWRTNYVFLAPNDYDFSYADVVVPQGSTLMLDGAAVTQTPTPIGGSQYSVLRLTLSAGSNAGAHTLTGNAGFGLQVIGYGLYTSYQYPGGLDLKSIAAPPPPIL